MVEKAQQNIGGLKDGVEMNVLADKGYHSGREIKACEELGVTTLISPKESSSTKTNPDFAMDSFRYDELQDSYTCPAGVTLHTNGRWYNKKLKNGRQSYKVKHYKTKACNGCRLRSQCTTNKRGRFIERTEYQQYVDHNNNRVNQQPDYYRQRQQIIEHQFGTLKRQWHFDYTLTKGKEKVLGEVYLAFTCYNLRRIMSILGFEALMSKMKALLLSSFQNYPSFFKKITSFNSFKSIFNFHNDKTENLATFSISW